MSKITNPDEVLLKKPEKKNLSLTEEELKGFTKQSPLTPIYDWVKKCKVVPYIGLEKGPEVPGGKAFVIGIKGTF